MSLNRESHLEDTGLDERLWLPPAPVQNPFVFSLEYVCEDCKAVDWDRISKSAANYALKGQVLIKHASVNKSHTELRRSSCQVCQLLAAIKPAFLDNKECAFAVTSISVNMGMPCSDSCTVIGFVHSPFCDMSFDTPQVGDMNTNGCLAVLGPDLDTLSIKPNDIKPDSIDYKLFHRLINMCGKEHSLTCKAHSDAGDIALHVIDIWTRKIVRAPERCRYIALSYVWGSAGDVTSGDDLVSAPLVVQDAISVTASMGCQYLWIDRYCIPQNSSEKHRMISNMDKVYSGAYLTIIAAAGNDAQSGLPGVSQFQRKPPKTLQLGETVRLQQVYLDPVRLLKATPWASRAWTYQEGFLSRWRLIFTKEQVLFLCNDTYFAESVALPIEAEYLEKQQAYRFNTLIGNERKHEDNIMGNIGNHIEEYSGRTLKYDTDSLNAFLGVLNHHTSTALKSHPMSHVWGVPFVIYNKGSYRQWRTPQWNPQAPSAAKFPFLWMHEKPARRRDEFPSWSWTGWAGIVRFPFTSINLSSDRPIEVEQNSRNVGSRSDIQFYVENMSEEGPDHEEVTLAELFRDLILSRQSNHEIDQNVCRRLLVSCLVSPLRLVNVELSGAQAKSKTRLEVSRNHWTVRRSSGAYAVFRLQQNVHVGAEVYWDEKCDEDAVFCLLLHHIQRSKIRLECGFLLVKRVYNDQYQRVGMVWVDLQPSRQNTCMIFAGQDGQVLDEVVLSRSSFSEPLLLGDGERRSVYLV